MNDTEQRIAIAEACGYLWWTFDYRGYHTPEKCQLTNFRPVSADWEIGEKFRAEPRKSKLKGAFGDQFEFVPNYLWNLDAMNEAEKSLSYEQQPVYVQNLKKVLMTEVGVTDWDVMHSTSKQRAEAFLRTVGKWKD